MIKKFKEPCCFSTSRCFHYWRQRMNCRFHGERTRCCWAGPLLWPFYIFVTLLNSAEPPLVSTRMKEEGLCHPAFVEIEAQQYLSVLIFSEGRHTKLSWHRMQQPSCGISHQHQMLLSVLTGFYLSTRSRRNYLAPDWGWTVQAPSKERDMCCSALRQKLPLLSPDLLSPHERCRHLARCAALPVGCRSCSPEVCHFEAHP